jgi:hypothetical protein
MFLEENSTDTYGYMPNSEEYGHTSNNKEDMRPAITKNMQRNGQEK